MATTIDTTDAPRRRTFFGAEQQLRSYVPANPSQRELLGQESGVDALTAELRERIMAASRVSLVGSLLPRRR
jgi:hypothetical protein